MSLELLAWRREVARLYAAYRTADDPQSGWRAWREGRDALFRTSTESPLREVPAGGLPYAPYDPAYRFVVPLRPAPAARLEVPTGTDGVVPFERVGRVELPGVGGLDVWWLASYGGGLFLPLRDSTCGRTAYGGGRYVLDTVKGADHGSAPDGRLVVDLNLAYAPSCAYDPAWACPLPPAGNTVDVPVPVGEQQPAGGWTALPAG